MLGQLKEKWKKDNSEEEEALSIRESKFGKKVNAEEAVARMSARQNLNKNKWAENKKSYMAEKKREIYQKKNLNSHSVNLVKKAEMKLQQNELETPSAIYGVYSTSLNDKNSQLEHNPMYAVQRLYETADRWSKDRQYYNMNFAASQVQSKPKINPKKQERILRAGKTRSMVALKSAPAKNIASRP